ncbi:Hpt domain-containing protein [Ralstonia sp. UBA689]|uniref:Hpt domain-containing protein n=1 Tax=Ralstonia sp. UBA689 TaxID=1947373 RepID=UPI00260143A9|nr:Hpt domain-containing protein [Ralstonia sp. UBA689]
MQPSQDTHAAPASQDACRATISGLIPSQVVTMLTELFGDDLQQWRFIVDLFAETVEQDLANLEKAIHGGVNGQIIEAAHRITGSAHMLGHLSIGDAARAIERTAQRVGPYNQRLPEMQSAFVHLRTVVDEFCRQASRCPWPDSAVAG